MSNTIMFNISKLSSDGTLKSMSKKELIKMIHNEHYNLKVADAYYNRAQEIINQLASEIEKIGYQIKFENGTGVPHLVKKEADNHD